ncbi:SIS domain-containing protein [Neiella marina]|uniref:SIS domain-containing protein n=1 Tax=Neiella holothuriorum TaxID=2870530 RepID=A0ABS7EAQ7_9GAMM|nr:SIS domain-containing protein [Neiella holothuriorum]MBW8189426.1 SIS domain-containing protein [Neiella holothuriorum]
MNSKTLMEQEAAQTPQVIAEQFRKNQDKVMAVAQKLQANPPKMVMIIGRGSSDHAGVFAKYLIEIETGVPVAAAAPSVVSIYGKSLKLADTLVIAISQSGRSPDILEQTKMCQAAGAYCIALVNDETSPLAALADDILPLSAGPENSVAATKSYLATLSALLQLTAYWSNSQSLIEALPQLPDALNQVIASQPQLTFAAIENQRNLVVLGRGLGYAVTKELALKLKEVCSIHAEAFSSAEFLHGPVTLVEQQLTIIDCDIADEAQQAHREQIKEVKQRGADVAHLTQVIKDVHPRMAPLLVLQRFYLDIAHIATEMGLNPDEPKGLKKVTKTL